ncbi:MFS transporter [Methanocella conradii]|uniref:MFS transporter n=1 Tax=Methanocella conradii TaxID=1175444 RepID=UPI00157DB52F|nr:MFS transporter [Methanocella conradii]
MRTIASFNTNVKLLLLRSFIVCLYMGIYGILFNLYILSLGYGADFLGLVLASNVLASSVMSIPAGILCDRYDKRALMIISGALSTLSAIPLYLLSSPYALLLFSVAGGAFVSISSVALTPMLAENARKEESVHVFSANASISWIASVAGSALGGILPGMWGPFTGLNAGGLRLTLLSSALLLAIGSILMLLVKESGYATKIRCGSLSLKALRPSADVVRFTVTSLTFGAASGMMVPYFNVYFVKALQAGVLEVGLVSAVAGAVMLAGFIITPYLTSKIGKVRSAALSKVFAAPFVMLMALSQSFLLAAAAYVAYVFFINMAGPATTSFQMEQIKPGEQGLALGMMMTGNYIAVSVSTYLSGLLIASENYLIPFVGTCIFYVLTAFLLYHYFKDAEKIAIAKNAIQRINMP